MIIFCLKVDGLLLCYVKEQTIEMCTIAYLQNNESTHFINSINHLILLIGFEEAVKFIKDQNYNLYQSKDSQSKDSQLNDSQSKDSQSQCSICLDNINDYVVKTCCAHYFHYDCIRQIKNNKCPMCRSTLNDRKIDFCDDLSDFEIVFTVYTNL